VKPPKTARAESSETPAEAPRYRLRLFVAGASQRSERAIANIKAIGEKHLSGRYDLLVIDAYQQADLVHENRILALPTLFKELPLPLRRLSGDLSDEKKVLVALDLIPEELHEE